LCGAADVGRICTGAASENDAVKLPEKWARWSLPENEGPFILLLGLPETAAVLRRRLADPRRSRLRSAVRSGRRFCQISGLEVIRHTGNYRAHPGEGRVSCDPPCDSQIDGVRTVNITLVMLAHAVQLASVRLFFPCTRLHAAPFRRIINLTRG
jgi:hypothetical protein